MFINVPINVENFALYNFSGPVLEDTILMLVDAAPVINYIFLAQKFIC